MAELRTHPQRGEIYTLQISFVVPAFNEERFLAATLQAIHRVVGNRYEYEVVVVDHQSTDRTCELAEQHGAIVFTRGARTIGGLRNFGCKRSSGGIIVFLDADVLLTDAWIEQFPNALHLLEEQPRTVVGGSYGSSAATNWLERYWFTPRLIRAKYVGTGHLLTTRAFFDELDGFDESLETGEDYDLSVRARRSGGSIVVWPGLKVIHEGTPRTLRTFVRREMWHGTGAFRSLKLILSSQVGLATLLYLLMHAVAVVCFSVGAWQLGLLSAGGIVALCIASSIKTFGVRTVSVSLVSVGLYYFYFVGRTLGLFRAVWPWRRKKWQRARVSEPEATNATSV